MQRQFALDLPIFLTQNPSAVDITAEVIKTSKYPPIGMCCTGMAGMEARNSAGADRGFKR